MLLFVLLDDATNALHLNRNAALKNIHSLCPPLATVLTNTYSFGHFLAIDCQTWVYVNCSVFLDSGIISLQMGRDTWVLLYIGTQSFLEDYMQDKVSEWVYLVSSIAKTKPHAVYSAFTHGSSCKLSYFLHTTNTADLLKPLEDAINRHFIPALTGRECASATERDLFALPVRCLGIIKPTVAPLDFSSAERITAPITDSSSHSLLMTLMKLCMGAVQCKKWSEKDEKRTAITSYLSVGDNSTQEFATSNGFE